MTELTLDTDILEKWIGKEESRTDTVDCKSVNQLQATLDHQNSNYQVGDPLPLAWHWMYFNPVVAASHSGTLFLSCKYATPKSVSQRIEPSKLP